MKKTEKTVWTAPALRKLGTIKEVAANNGTIAQVGNSAKS